MSLTPTIAVRIEGLFFSDADTHRTLRANIGAMMDAVAAEGQTSVRALFPVGGDGDPHPGFGQAGVIGRTRSLTGKQWAAHAVISEGRVYPAPASTGANTGRRAPGTSKSTRYRGGKLEAKLHMFGTVTRELNQSRAVLAADLTKGLE